MSVVMRQWALAPLFLILGAAGAVYFFPAYYRLKWERKIERESVTALLESLAPKPKRTAENWLNLGTLLPILATLACLCFRAWRVSLPSGYSDWRWFRHHFGDFLQGIFMTWVFGMAVFRPEATLSRRREIKRIVGEGMVLTAAALIVETLHGTFMADRWTHYQNKGWAVDWKDVLAELLGAASYLGIRAMGVRALFSPPTGEPAGEVEKKAVKEPSTGDYARTTAAVAFEDGRHYPAELLREVMPEAKDLEVGTVDGRCLRAVGDLGGRLEELEFHRAFTASLAAELKARGYSDGSVSRALLSLQNFVGRGAAVGADDPMKTPVLVSVVREGDMKEIGGLVDSQIKAFEMGGVRLPHLVLVPADDKIAGELRRAHGGKVGQNIHVLDAAFFVEDKLDVVSLNGKFEAWRGETLGGGEVRVTLAAPKEMLSAEMALRLEESSPLREAVENLWEILKKMPIVSSKDLKILLDLAVLIAKQA